MDMTKGQIMKAGIGHLRLGHGIVRGIALYGVSVEQCNMIFFVAAKPEVFQQRIAIHGHKSSTIDAAI